jgi:hypothetical protein
VKADTGLGVVDEREDWAFPDGELLVEAMWTRSERVLFGPTAGLGAFWRAPTLHDNQLGPMASFGGRASLPIGPAWVALDLALHAVPIDGVISPYPSITATVGARIH